MPVKFRSYLVLFVFLCLGMILPQKIHAASLSNASASATTSRPSASAPLSADYSASAANVTVIDNSSTYLSSDSAVFFRNGTQEYVQVSTTSANRLTVYFTGNTSSAHDKTGVLAVPITAMHQIVFTTQTAIPSGGTIEISYPTSSSFTGQDTVQASPSANTWMFNGLSTSNIKQKFSQGAATCSWALSGVTNGSNGQTPKAVCTTSGGTIPGGSTVWIWLGCSSYTNGTACATQAPTIINPTHSSSGSRGLADVKSIGVATYDSPGGSQLDTSTLKMGTIESVFVVAHIDPTFSFNIDGVAASTDMHTSGTCSTSYANISTNSSFPSTSTDVNMGTISSAGNTYAAQKMTLQSNTGSGYVITATSSGFLMNPASGQYVVNAQGNVTNNNTPVPTTISSTTGGYGINACDANSRVNTTIWGQASPNFANPSSSYYYTLVNYPSAPSASGGDVIFVVYGARAGSATPPGDYWQIMTYTASVTF